MEHEPDIFDQRHPDVEAAAIARGPACAVAGRVHDHALVGPWLGTIVSPGYKPSWEWLAGRNG